LLLLFGGFIQGIFNGKNSDDTFGHDGKFALVKQMMVFTHFAVTKWEDQQYLHAAV